MGQKSVAVGLKILINQKIYQGNNDLIMYSSRFTRVKPIFHTNHTDQSNTANYSLLLKYCFLCNKSLKLDKEAYMYRGDLGFCSVECRNRQIYLDEIKEIERCTRSFRRCGDSGHRCSETSVLLEEYKQRRNPKKNIRPIFTFS